MWLRRRRAFSPVCAPPFSPNPSTRPPVSQRFTRIAWLIGSNDPEETFNEAADHIIYQSNNYTAWAEKAGQNRNPVYIRDRAHLRETGSFKVADPDTCVKMIREYLDKSRSRITTRGRCPPDCRRNGFNLTSNYSRPR